MKLVYSYWSKPLNKRWDKYTQGLNLENYEDATYNCIMLSVLYAKKWGFKVELVTDLEGQQRLKSLPFDKVTVELEFLNFTGKSWVQGKVMAIALQKEPFIHIDWDVLLLKQGIVTLFKNFKEDLLIQSVDGKEIFESNYMAALTNLHWHMDYTQYHIKGLHKLHEKAFNCGVMGFNNMRLKDLFVESFIKCWKESDKEMEYDMSLVIEQGLLYSIVEAEGFSYKTILNNNNNQVAKEIGYTHLVYLSKYTKDVQDKIRRRIFNEFPTHSHLINKTKPKHKTPLLSICTVVMNRKEHLSETLKKNYQIVKGYNGEIDVNIIDYNSTDGVKDFLFKQKYFIEGVKNGIIHYYKNEDAKIYHRTLPKNKIHSLAKGQYLVNVDADNYVKSGYIEFVINHIKNKTQFFIRPDKYENTAGFGRILLSKEDFEILGGYNLNFATYGFEDGEIVARLKLLGRTQILAPTHLCNENIEHDDSMRIEDKTIKRDIKKNLKDSEIKNKQISVTLFPNAGKKLECEVVKIAK